MSLRVLFVGLGSIGQRHLRNLRALVGPDLVVWAYRARGADHILTDGLEVAAPGGLVEQYQIRLCNDLYEALDGGAEVVFVTNPTSLHLPFALAAARAGCHVFVEKPISHTWEGVEALIDAADRHGRVGYVGLQWRFHPAFQHVQEWLRRDRIGPIAAVRAQIGEYLPDCHRYEDYRTSYAAQRALGGGVILSQIHAFDAVYALMGMPRSVVSVGGHLSNLEMDVEDVASTLMTYERPDGRRVPVHLHQDFLQRPSERGYEIIGTRGRIAWNVDRGNLTCYGADGSTLDALDFSAVPRNQVFLDELRHFLDCLEGRCRPVVSLREGAQSLRIALAAKASLETGRVVELQEASVS